MNAKTALLTPEEQDPADIDVHSRDTIILVGFRLDAELDALRELVERGELGYITDEADVMDQNII